MKKLGLILCSSFFILHSSFSQGGWYPVGKGFAGSAGDGVLAMCPYDSVLFVGGGFNMAGGMPANCIAQWNGANWSAVGEGVKLTDGHISALAMYHGKLYAGGEFDSAGGKAAVGVAVWNGVTWSPVGNWTKHHPARFADIVNGLYVFNDELYATGVFDSIGYSRVNNIARWNDEVWDSVGPGFSVNQAGQCFTIFKGKLYVGGFLDTIGNLPVSVIASWDGIKWDSVGAMKWDGGGYGLCSYDSMLFMGGVFHYPGIDSLQDLNHINYIAQWNGINWDSVGSSYSVFPNISNVFAVTIFNGDLIVGGTSKNGGIARWNGSSWSVMDSGMNGDIGALAVFKGNLYAGGGRLGGFSVAGGRICYGIAVWGNDTFTGINEVKVIGNEMKLYPNPNGGQYDLNYTILSTDKGEMLVNNEMGALVGTYNLDPNNTTLKVNASTLNEGIYFYRIIVNGKQVKGDKFVIIK